MRAILRWTAMPFAFFVPFLLAVLFGYFVSYMADLALSQTFGLHLPVDWRTQIAQIVGYGGAAWLVIVVPAIVAPAHPKVVALITGSLYWIIQVIGFIAVVVGLFVGYGLSGDLLRIVAALIGTGVGISQVWEDPEYAW